MLFTESMALSMVVMAACALDAASRSTEPVSTPRLDAVRSPSDMVTREFDDALTPTCTASVDEPVPLDNEIPLNSELCAMRSTSAESWSNSESMYARSPSSRVSEELNGQLAHPIENAEHFL